MRTALLLIAFLCAGVSAGEFDAVGFYGKDYFTPGAKLAGKLALKLDRDHAPPFADLNNSDDGPATPCFEFTQTGAVLKPAGAKSSCELGLDIGAASCRGSVSVVELDAGASVGFHLVELGTDREFIIDVRRDESGATLRIARRTQHGMSPLRTAALNSVDFKQAHALSLVADSSRVSAEFAGAKVEIGDGVGAFSLGVAGSDGRSRVSNLELAVNFDEGWAQDAQARLFARQALARLNEYCTQGLLAGISRFPHPSQEADLKLYSSEQIKARGEALANTFLAARFEALDALAKARPKSALAAYEAGVAALLAGYSLAARERLEASLQLHECSIARLVLAEALRRLREFESAQQSLTQSRKDLGAALEPDHELLRGRLLAARGDIAGAAKLLVAAAAKWTDHEALKLFAESARELVAPQTLSLAKVEGPLGLSVVSDVDDALLAKLITRLKPYVERIRYWLPELAKDLDGTIAIYATPTAYLRAALLVAGDSLDNVAGMFLPAGFGGGRSVLACRAFGEDELFRTLVHELWHLAVSTTKQADMEPWLNEGMAVYLSAGVVREGVMAYGALPAEFTAIDAEVAQALAGTSAAEATMAAGAERFYLPGAQRLNYAMGWALAWFHAEQDMASERTLRALLAGDKQARQSLQASLAQLMPRLAKALKVRKVLR